MCGLASALPSGGVPLCPPVPPGLSRAVRLYAQQTVEGGRANGIRPYNLFPEIGREAESGPPYVFLAPRTANGRPYTS